MNTRILLVIVSVASTAFLTTTSTAGLLSNSAGAESRSAREDGIFASLISDDYGQGALTLDNLYRFDYANAGIGTVIFVPRKSAIAPINWSLSSNSFMAQQSGGRIVAEESGMDVSIGRSPFDRSAGLPAGFVFQDDDGLSAPNVIPPIPEPSTWVAAAFALAFILFTQRRRVWSR